MVSDRKWENLRERMQKLGIREEDIEEKFVRSSGKGGQHVNKVATCVMLEHAPTGIRVRCEEARSQHENRYHARKRLCDKVDEKIHGAKSRAAKERHKIRARKRKRSKRAKEKMLESKRRRSEKRKLRRDPKLDE